MDTDNILNNDINYCSKCWREFTTMTEREYQNYEQIVKLVKDLKYVTEIPLDVFLKGSN